MKTFNKKIATGLLIGSLCALSIGATVFANSDASATEQSANRPGFKADKGMPFHQHKMMEEAKTKLDKLVSEGVISEDQKTKLISIFKEKAAQMKTNMEKLRDMSPEERQAQFKQFRDSHPDFFAEIKAAAGLSDDQMKAVATALRPQHPRMNAEQLAQKLNKLVSDGIITEAQSNSTLSFMKDKAEQRRAEMDKIHQMSPEERQAYFDEHTKKRPDIVNDLKAAAGLSDEQAKAVLAAIHPKHGHHGPRLKAPADTSIQ